MSEQLWDFCILLPGNHIVITVPDSLKDELTTRMVEYSSNTTIDELICIQEKYWFHRVRLLGFYVVSHNRDFQEEHLKVMREQVDLLRKQVDEEQWRE